jgi:hypothetical protein
MLILKISEAHVTEQGSIMITSVSVIDELGNTVRPAKLTKELAEFICTWEINADEWMEMTDIARKMNAKNKAFGTLVKTFGLKI